MRITGTTSVSIDRARAINSQQSLAVEALRNQTKSKPIVIGLVRHASI